MVAVSGLIFVGSSRQRSEERTISGGLRKFSSILVKEYKSKSTTSFYCPAALINY
jgi:hypothetical protein